MCFHQDGAFYTRHTRRQNVCRSASLSVSPSLIPTRSRAHTRSCQAPPLPQSSIFSLHQLSDAQQWAVTLQKNRAREGGRGGEEGERGGGRVGCGKEREEHCRNCEGKREIFKEGVRRVWTWKKIEREQVVEWVRISEGHVSDFLNVMRQHGGGCSHGWRSGEASLMAHTTDERNWSPWKKELNNSKRGGKRESGGEGGDGMRAAGWRV